MMKFDMRKNSIITWLICLLISIHVFAAEPKQGLYSLDLGKTITKVRTAKHYSGEVIIAASYNGNVSAMAFYKHLKWSNDLSGYVNHDIWAADITGDGFDEILLANADGSIYCLNTNGSLRWTFSANDVPMYSVTVVSKNGENYVVAGGYDKKIYYLSNKGKLVKTIDSATYSKERTFGKKTPPPNNTHVANFIRPLRKEDGKQALVVHGFNNSMQTRGSIYLFDILADMPYQTTKLKSRNSYGSMTVADTNNDNVDELLMGSTSMLPNAVFTEFNTLTQQQDDWKIDSVKRELDIFGYRVTQIEHVSIGGKPQFAILFGSRLILLPQDKNSGEAEVLVSDYAFNDMWQDSSGRLILASAQSGGSAVHIVDFDADNWKAGYRNLTPPGNITEILDNTNKLRAQLKAYKKPLEERDPLLVYMISDDTSAHSTEVNNYHDNYTSPKFLKNIWMRDVERWDRFPIKASMPKHFASRDSRKRYILDSSEIQKRIVPHYASSKGVSYWGGHGTDPYQISLATQKKIMEQSMGKKTVHIFPEIEHYDDESALMLENLIYPLAEFSKTRNANIFLRNKHTFWQSVVHLPLWRKLRSGKYADVFVPAMEETTDKSMELSIAGRVGLWMSGAVNQWGTRYSRDNTSYDRMRQHSHQMIPNHALRQYVYNLSLGATYVNNFSYNQEYLSVLWELLAKGVLYVPKREELLSINPVHLSMKSPNKEYLSKSNNVKWTTFYDEASDKEAFVFGRLNGTWPGAKNTAFDFSRYAAGVHDRRLNFLPPYNHGLVMITPVQEGVFADDGEVMRDHITQYLHPIYKHTERSFITDGKHYYSHNGKKSFGANSDYQQNIAAAIRENKEILPMSVDGDVAWVVAQSGDTKLRLTLIDGGYINPSQKKATVHFHSIKPVAVTNLLSGEKYSVSKDTAQITVPTGLFAFIEVEMGSAFDYAKVTTDITGQQRASVYEFNVEYIATKPREIVLELTKDDKKIDGTIIRVEKGNRSQKISLHLEAPLPAGKGYSINTYIRSIGSADPTDALNKHTINNIEIVI